MYIGSISLSLVFLDEALLNVLGSECGNNGNFNDE